MTTIPRMPEIPKNPAVAGFHDLKTIGLRQEARLETIAAATLVSGLIAAAGRPHSIQEALAMMSEVQHALFPNPQLGSFRKWSETKDESLTKTRT